MIRPSFKISEDDFCGGILAVDVVGCFIPDTFDVLSLFLGVLFLRPLFLGALVLDFIFVKIAFYLIYCFNYNIDLIHSTNILEQYHVLQTMYV